MFKLFKKKVEEESPDEVSEESLYYDDIYEGDRDWPKILTQIFLVLNTSVLVSLIIWLYLTNAFTVRNFVDKPYVNELYKRMDALEIRVSELENFKRGVLGIQDSLGSSGVTGNIVDYKSVLGVDTKQILGFVTNIRKQDDGIRYEVTVNEVTWLDRNQKTCYDTNKINQDTSLPACNKDGFLIIDDDDSVFTVKFAKDKTIVVHSRGSNLTNEMNWGQNITDDELYAFLTASDQPILFHVKIRNTEVVELIEQYVR